MDASPRERRTRVTRRAGRLRQGGLRRPAPWITLRRGWGADPHGPTASQAPKVEDTKIFTGKPEGPK